jgi:hypothetical protein
MQQELMKVLTKQEMWGAHHQRDHGDYGSLVHAFSEMPKARHHLPSRPNPQGGSPLLRKT